LFSDFTHAIGVPLGIEGASVLLADEPGKIAERNAPGNGQRVEVRTVATGVFFALQLTKGVHERDGDIGEHGGTASGDFPAGDGADQAREKDGNVPSGTELIEIADEVGGGILFRLMRGAERGAGRGGVAATASGGCGVRATRSHWNLSEGEYPGDFGEECGRGRKKERWRWYEK